MKLDNNFSLVHFNCRSLYTNLDKIIDYLNTLKSQFDVIAFSETWLNADKGYDLGIEGYSLYHVDRPGKRGGGVAVFVKETYRTTIIERMSVAIEGLLECVAVEIELETKQRIIIACVYRAQGSNVEVFKDKLTALVDCSMLKKTMW